jgi:mercury(II) reductase
MAEACCAERSPPENGYDLAVIGAGSAGFSAAIRGAELGARVLLIGHGTIGGTCVNVGCVPSKTLIRATVALHAARIASRFAGIDASAQVLNWSATVKQKDELVGTLREAKYIDLLPQYPSVTYVTGAAHLTRGGLSLNGREITVDRIIVATGARPAEPAIVGVDAVPYLTSTTALSLMERPKSLLVLGGGYVGAELAQMFARAGVAVTLAFRSRLLPSAEPEISAALSQYLRREGIEIREGLAYRNIRRTKKGVVLEALQQGVSVSIDAEQLLLATGRQPKTEELGLDRAGVDRTADGAIEVDAHMRTTKPGVYAAGDVTGRDQFVYMAAYGAKLAAENALQGDRRRYDASAMPAIVFTDPQVASAGLTEAQARAQGLHVRTSVQPLEHLPRALAARDTRGLIKLIADARDGRLLGAHILAPEGADSIQTAVLAIKHRLTITDLAETLFPYLTTVEGLKLAAQAFDKEVSKLSCCAG